MAHSFSGFAGNPEIFSKESLAIFADTTLVHLGLVFI